MGGYIAAVTAHRQELAHSAAVAVIVANRCSCIYYRKSRQRLTLVPDLSPHFDGTG
ncbi:hypothetical protein MJD09_24915 [bacterium]|nr:hypothetical protein [bacterium]